MARPLDTKRKAALRAGAAGYLLEHGLPAFSLRPLAESLGTSARMLIHHFGTRENLLREAMEEIREQEQAAYRKHRAPSDGTGDTLRWHWHRMTRPTMRSKLPQLFALYVDALRDPKAAAWLFETPLRYWMDVLAESGGRAQAARATLVLATLRGCLLDKVHGRSDVGLLVLPAGELDEPDLHAIWSPV